MDGAGSGPPRGVGLMGAGMDSAQARHLLSRAAFPTFEEACRAFGVLSAEERKTLFIHKTRPVFEVFNRTYVNALARYILSGGFRTVLEVGAGDGRLGRYLGEALKRAARQGKGKGEHPRPLRLLPVDDGTWNIEPVFPVEKLGLEEGLRRFAPDLVIWCWMPVGDWTFLIRGHPSVREYLLIGETDGGWCGNEDTWNPGLLARDGFQRVDLDELSRLQLARNDESPPPSRSRTVAFRRYPPQVSP